MLIVAQALIIFRLAVKYSESVKDPFDDKIPSQRSHPTRKICVYQDLFDEIT